MDRRKLNDVFTVPQSKNNLTIRGVIGNGKTREEVVLQKNVELDKVDLCVVKWKHRIGEKWRTVEESTKFGY